jgi:hypothetical protein
MGQTGFQTVKFGAQTATAAPAPEPSQTPVPSPKRQSRRWFTRLFLGALALGGGALGYRIHQNISVIQSTQLNETVAAPGYQSQPAVKKQQILWQLVAESPYTVLPRTDSAGVTSGSGLGKLDSFVKVFDGHYMRDTFDQAADVRPPHAKLFHPFGAVAQVEFVPRPGHPFTGFYSEGGIGLARLSLAASEAEYSPGIALKLLVDGKPSVNVFAIPSLEPQSSRDFFLRTPTNHFPVGDGFVVKQVNGILEREAGVAAANRVRVDHLAAIGPSGQPVTSPNGPDQIEFRPAQVHFDPNTTRDFRMELADIPPGTVIYEVWGRSASTGDSYVPLGSVRTTSPFVASRFGDEELSFQHPR